MLLLALDVESVFVFVFFVLRSSGFSCRRVMELDVLSCCPALGDRKQYLVPVSFLFFHYLLHPRWAAAIRKWTPEVPVRHLSFFFFCLHPSLPPSLLSGSVLGPRSYMIPYVGVQLEAVYHEPLHCLFLFSLPLSLFFF